MRAGIAHLQTLGLSTEVIATYDRALALGTTTVPALAAHLRHPPAQVRAWVDELVALGLLSASQDSAQTVRVVFPGPALQRLAASRAAEVEYAQTAVLASVEAARRGDLAADLGAVVEVVAGSDVADRLAHAEQTAQHQVRSLDAPPYYAEGLRDHVEPSNLRRGVRYRVVYAATALDRPGVLTGSIAPLIRDGEDARTLATVATKLMIFDDRLAFVSAVLSADGSAPVLLVRPSGLFNALVGLFEYTWRTAAELDATGRARTAPLSAADHRLLALLAGGATDEQVARALGISRRTFFRRLDRLMKLSGAMTRFELAVQAGRLGWL